MLDDNLLLECIAREALLERLICPLDDFKNHSCLPNSTLRLQHEGTRRMNRRTGYACNSALVRRQAGQG